MRVCEETAYVSRLVEGVAELLLQDTILRVRHASPIRNFCAGEQMLRELAAVLELGCSADAVLAKVTGPMRQRLLRARMRRLARKAGTDRGAGSVLTERDQARYDLVVGAVSHKTYRKMEAKTLEALIAQGGTLADLKGIWSSVVLDPKLNRWTL